MKKKKNIFEEILKKHNLEVKIDDKDLYFTKDELIKIEEIPHTKIKQWDFTRKDAIEDSVKYLKEREKERQKNYFIEEWLKENKQ